MRYLITLTMGIEFDRNNEVMWKITVWEGLDMLRDKLCDTLGGYTETETKGGWKREDGDVIEERGRQFQALTGEIDSLMEVDKLARSLASYAASALHQASVMYTFTPVTAGFVGPNEA